MNKEEYKCNFIQQFNQPDSAIRTLMFNMHPTLRLYKSLYIDSAYYANAEFMLEIDINKRVVDGSHGLDYYFEIIFNDAAGIIDMDISPRIVLDGRTGNNLCQKSFYTETVEFVNDEIRFSLKHSKLELTNYDFNLGHIHQIPVLSYNVKTRTFDMPDIQMDVLLEGWQSIRQCKNQAYYIDYPKEQKLIDALNVFLSGLGISEIGENNILTAFESASRCNRDISPMAKIIKHLR